MDNVRFITEDESTAYDMAADFGCIMAHREIGAPVAKSDFIDIPFRSGSINTYNLITKEPVYENRTITIDFLYLEGNKTDLISRIYQAVHGRALFVEFSEDVGYWYKSEVTNIKKVKQTNMALSFRIECTCQPYKFERLSTLAEWEWDGLNLENGIINDLGELTIQPKTTARFTLMCRIGRARPLFETDQRLTLIDTSTGLYEYINPGKTKLYEYVFKEGENNLSIYNSGTDVAHVKIEYRGESL